jgi:hypothetical protein
MVFLQGMALPSHLATQTYRHYNGRETSVGSDLSTLSDMENWLWRQRSLHRWSG